MLFRSGYAGGHVPNPTYEQIGTKKTGHAEVIKIDYDPAVVSLETLLDYFWSVHNPTQVGGQGNDHGPQYRSIILYTDDTQKAGETYNVTGTPTFIVNGRNAEVASWDALEPSEGAEARELRGLISMALVLTTIIASVTAVAVFRNEGERALDGSLAIARSSMAEGAQTILSLRSTRAAIITTRPLLRAGVRRLALVPNDPAALAAARSHLEGFLGYGFSYIALLDARGRPDRKSVV